MDFSGTTANSGNRFVFLFDHVYSVEVGAVLRVVNFSRYMFASSSRHSSWLMLTTRYTIFIPARKSRIVAEFFLHKLTTFEKR